MYLRYIDAHPGCSIADVNRNCKRNPLAGHRHIYDSVNRLIRRKLVKRKWVNNKTYLEINKDEKSSC